MRRACSAACSVLWLVLGGCGAQPAARSTALSATTTLAWGDGARELARSAPRQEAQVAGPSAVAIDAHGRGYVLDRLHGRVLGLDSEASIAVPVDAELLAVAADGVIAVYSALRSRVELFGADGAALGVIAVPRALGPIGAIALGPSRRVVVTTALQERFELGSPRFPLPLPVTLAGKHEGAVALADGAGVAVIADKRQLTLLVHERGRKDARRLRVSGAADAAQLVGSDGSIACLRSEHIEDDAPLRVARRLICVETTTGRTVLDRALPPPGLYLPRTELAVGGGRVVLMTPTSAGVVVTRHELDGGGR